MNRNMFRTRKASQVEEKIEPSHGIGKIQGISGMRYWPVWLGRTLFGVLVWKTRPKKVN